MLNEILEITKKVFYYIVLSFFNHNVCMAEVPLSEIKVIKKFNYKGALNSINNILIHPQNSSLFFTTSIQGVLSAWNTNQQNPIWEIDTKISILDGLAITSDGKAVIVSGEKDQVKIFEALNGVPLVMNFSSENANILPFKPHHLSLAVVPNTERFATADTNGFVYFWQIGFVEPLAVVKVSDYPISHLSFSTNGQYLIFGNNRELKIWSLLEEKITFDLAKETNQDVVWIESFSFHDHDKYVLISTFTDVIIVDVDSNEVLKHYPEVIHTEEQTFGVTKIMTDSNMQNLWKVNKSTIIEKLDIDSGKSLKTYSLFSSVFQPKFFTMAVPILNDSGKIIASDISFDARLFENQLKLTSNLALYGF